MSTRLLVPLDGSTLAEKALPYAINLSHPFGAQLLLVRVVETLPKTSNVPSFKSEQVAEAQSYLDKVRETIIDPATGLNIPPDDIQVRVLYGEPPTEIAELAALEKPELIVMATHGHAGLSHLVLGNRAAAILHRTDTPVVLIRPTGSEKTQALAETITMPTSLSAGENGYRVVVTLDGSPVAEAAIDPAIELAQKLGATVYLLRAVLPYIEVQRGFITPGRSPAEEKENETLREAAYTYLDTVLPRVTAKGLNGVKVVRMGTVSETITAYLEEVHASIVVMATHARGRVGQFFLGSVAEHVVHKSYLPVMMVHSHPLPKEQALIETHQLA